MATHRTDDEKKEILAQVAKYRKEGRNPVESLKAAGITSGQYYLWRNRLKTKSSPVKRLRKKPSVLEFQLPEESSRLVVLMGKSSDILAVLERVRS